MTTATATTQSWQETYQRKLTTPEEAVKVVRSGDIVSIPIFPPATLLPALYNRRDDLRDVTIRLLAPASDPGWLKPGVEDHFNVEFELYIGDFARFASDEHRGPYLPNLFSTNYMAHDDGREEADNDPDVLVASVTPPNSQGYVQFGAHSWTKHAWLKRGVKTIAEVDPTIVAVHGDVWAHVSEFEALVEYTPPDFTEEQFEAAIAPLDAEKQADWRALWGELVNPARLAPLAAVLAAVSPDDVRRFLGMMPPPEFYHEIAKHLKGLIKDGDCIQIGTGEPSRVMAKLGVFAERNDLGIHTELGWPGLAQMVKDGIANGRRKTIETGLAVATAWTGCDDQDFEIIADNPAFQLHPPDYVLNLRNLLAIDNFVSINNAISIDLTGQVTAESVFGGRMINGTGGQPEMHLGGFFSKGGRAITLLPSTALADSVSRIVPQLDAGTIVTVPRFYADLVVTEYGVAKLLNRNHRQRAEALIEVAHPNFRDGLREKAKELFWP
ncbi:MAG TPA: acetyl-CoA hydrolase/transferase C-terminal domain-containing protein [Dehalococcoidia bacterium]|nr:acetyl-CoA hydrolase/transferase C-terminal domain-containing protein [Dehalococcoidia bacterium]